MSYSQEDLEKMMSGMDMKESGWKPTYPKRDGHIVEDIYSIDRDGNLIESYGRLWIGHKPVRATDGSKVETTRLSTIMHGGTRSLHVPSLPTIINALATTARKAINPDTLEITSERHMELLQSIFPETDKKTMYWSNSLIDHDRSCILHFRMGGIDKKNPEGTDKPYHNNIDYSYDKEKIFQSDIKENNELHNTEIDLLGGDNYRNLFLIASCVRNDAKLDFHPKDIINKEGESGIAFGFDGNTLCLDFPSEYGDTAQFLPFYYPGEGCR